MNFTLHLLLVGSALLSLSLLLGCEDDTSRCPTFAQEEVAPGCTVSVSDQEEPVDVCGTVPLDADACPAVGSVAVGELEQASQEDGYVMRVACGPLSAPTGVSGMTGTCCYRGLSQRDDACAE